MRMPRTKPQKISPHRKPFTEIKGGIPPERAAELLAAAKRAEINQSHYNGGQWIDYTRPWFDGAEVVK